jgi:ribA/ribD-fused uncharacterized protein
MIEENNHQSSKYIKFYKASDRYGFLSNFSLHSFMIKGKIWRTVEHYYQAQKFAGRAYEETIRSAGAPGKAKKLGNARDAKAGPIRTDWAKVKEHIMYEGLTAKFMQNEKIHDQLLATGNNILVESSRKDKYWGDGGNGSGLNRLGALLMNLREELKNNTAVNPATANQHEQAVQPATDEDHHSEEDYSESSDGIEKIANELDVEDDDNDIEPINQYGTIIATGPSRPTTAQKARKKKNRNQMRKNIWKDETGSSILARDNEVRDQVSVVNQNINIPMNVLPPNAKLVVHQHQYKRRYLKESDDGIENEEDEDYEDTYDHQRSNKKSTLSDYIVVDKSKKNTQTHPPQTVNANNPETMIATAAENLILIKSLSPSEPIYEEIKQNLVSLKPSLIQLTELTTQDNVLSQLLSHIEAINELEH